MWYQNKSLRCFVNVLCRLTDRDINIYSAFLNDSQNGELDVIYCVFLV